MSAATALPQAPVPAPSVPRSFLPVLERLQYDAAAHFDAPAIRLVPAGFEERILSSVLRVGVGRAGDTHPHAHVFVKIFKMRPAEGVESMRTRLVHDFETTRRIYEGMAVRSDVGAVRPVAYYPEHFAIVTEEVPGQTLGAYVERHARWFPDARTTSDLCDVAARVGRWVQAFQTLDLRPGAISPGELRRYIDVRLERLVALPAARFSVEDRARVQAHIDALARRVPAGDLREVPVHADLAPGNVFIAGPRIVVIDFAMTRRGNRMHDISRLYVQLELLCAKPQFQRRTVRLLQQALLHGFDPALREDHPLFRLLLLLHRINHLNTLSVRRERFPSSLHNAHLRHLHRRWIAGELSGRSREPL